MNIKSGTSLAIFQDRLFKQYINGDYTINDKDSRELNGNLWVALAKRMSPNNLVIRHRCLQDLFNGNKKFLEEILDLYKILAPGLFVEGYSYWKYTKPFLFEWGKLYYPEMITTIDYVDKLFVVTSYYGQDGLLYPAPFGDVRNEPLESTIQNIDKPYDSFAVCPIIKRQTMFGYQKYICYDISSYPLGCNLHVPIKNETIVIKDGVPQRFKFYEGYDKKYKNGFVEFLDLINLKRLFSIFKK